MFQDNDSLNNSKILFTLEVELTENQKEKITVYENTDIKRLVYDFSLKYNLDYDSHLQLLKRIQNEKSNYKPILTNSSRGRKIMSSKSSLSYKNYIDSFYSKNMMYLNEKNKKISQLKEELDKSFDEIATFKPQINVHSSSNEKYRQQNKKNYNNNQILTNYKSYLDEKIQNLRKKHSKECTFVPQIIKNKNMNKNGNQDSNSLNRYEILYDDFKKREKKKEDELKKSNISSDIYTFRPEINKDKNYNNTKSLKSSKSETFLRLYKYADFYKNNLTDKIKLKNFNENSNKQIHTTQSSNNIYQNKKEEIFKKLFHTLDRDEDGLISRIYIDTSKIPKNILKIITPVLNLMNEKDNALNEYEFVLSCISLFDYLDYKEKNLLLNYGKENNIKKSYQSNFTFKPNLNKIPIKIIKTERMKNKNFSNYPNFSKRFITNNNNL
jgi:hypothetical protein